MTPKNKPTPGPQGKHKIVPRRLTRDANRIPRSTDGTVKPWVVELARLRAAGWSSTKLLAARLGRDPSRIRQVMLDPDYQTLEVIESLRVLGSRRARAIAALGDKAESGDVAAVRLVLELTKVIEPARPLLVQIASITGVSVSADPPMIEPATRDAGTLQARRDELFSKLFGGQPPVDVIFRETPPTNGTNGNGSGDHDNDNEGGSTSP